ncbi:MAG: response regulator [Deltaproteobacteria bacterium]|nr:MAG: response regulator [Deltaproteobacteria bacterium]
MQSLRILCVDDEAMVRDYLCDLLEADGCAVTTARSVSEARAALAGGTFDLVTLDLAMPGPSGMEFLRELRKDHPNLPVVILTGYPSVESAQEAVELGATKYMTKPFAGDDLQRVVAEVARKLGIARAREDDFVARVGQRIREIRRSREMTLSQLGAKCGFSPAKLSMIERACAPVNLAGLFRIAAALGVTVEALVRETDATPPDRA